MKKNVLFIADSSLRNPILQSQGFPFLYNLDHTKYKPFVLSFEEGNLGKEEIQEIESIIKKFESKIKFLPVVINDKGILRSWFFITLKRCKILFSIVRKNNIKMLHARSFKPALLSIIIKILFYFSIKVIYDNRGLYIDELIFRNGLSKGSLKEKIYRTIERIIINNCDRMVVVSNAFKSYIVEQFGSNNKNIVNKTSMIPNRIELNFNDSDIVIRREHIQDRTICVYSGSSASWQGIDDFYSFFSLILNKIPTTHFKILSYQPEVFFDLSHKNINLAERIIVKKVDFSNVKYELINATFGIILRKHDIVSRVSSPIKFAEYLSAGLPVLLHEGIGDTEQIIKNYNVGVIIKKNKYEIAISELQELLNDEEISERCLRAAEKEFNITSSFEQYQEIYDNL